MGPHRRSSSISPSDSPPQARSLIGNSTFDTFAEHVDESNHSGTDFAPDGNRKSLLDFTWKRREGDVDYKQPHDPEQSKSNATLGQNQEDRGRHRSRFGSIGSAIKKGLGKIRHRNDSTQDDATPSIPTAPVWCDVGIQPLSATVSRDESRLRREEMYNYTADLEPFARNGMLRFHNMSQSQDDLFRSPSGPSTFYEDHRFEERRCSVQHHSPYCARRNGFDSSDWVYASPSTPTPETNAEAGADPYQWQRLSGHSPGPTPKRRGLSQYSVRRLPNFVRPSRYGNLIKRPSVATAPPAKPRGCLEVSCAPSAESTVSTFSVSKPNLFHPVPSLDGTFPLEDQLGVLPTIDSASINTSSDVPQVQYSTVSSCSPAPSMTPSRAVPSICNTTNISTASSSDQTTSPYGGPSCNSSLQLLRPPPSVSTDPPSSSPMAPYPWSTLSTDPPTMSSLSLNSPLNEDFSGSTMALGPTSPCIPPPKRPDTPPHPKPQTHPHAQCQEQAHPQVQHQQQPRNPYPYPEAHPLFPTHSLNSHPTLLNAGSQDTQTDLTSRTYLNCTPSPAITAIDTDTASTHSSLGLRRTESLAYVLDSFNVDGDGDGDSGSEVPACGVMCCASRGRRRTRSGNMLGTGDWWCVSTD
jgi:hypothetical protein